MASLIHDKHEAEKAKVNVSSVSPGMSAGERAIC